MGLLQESAPPSPRASPARKAAGGSFHLLQVAGYRLQRARSLQLETVAARRMSRQLYFVERSFFLTSDDCAGYLAET